ncbi:hypothetical protein HMPREF9073_02553 [Capnocytophaga sp. oral taxon 326 str. F0382]|nr:hypothetical protein HMPREF9073_02553 [Capnocytophaga sp. oral taxon 326 str. F0382]
MFNQFFREIDSFPFLGRRIYSNIIFIIFNYIYYFQLNSSIETP